MDLWIEIYDNLKLWLLRDLFSEKIIVKIASVSVASIVNELRFLWFTDCCVCNRFDKHIGMLEHFVSLFYKPVRFLSQTSFTGYKITQSQMHTCKDGLEEKIYHKVKKIDSIVEEGRIIFFFSCESLCFCNTLWSPRSFQQSEIS